MNQNITNVLRGIVANLVIFTVISKSTLAQSGEISGWFFLSHSQEFNKKWSYMTDVQLRTSGKFKYLQNVLVRPGLLYHLTDKQSVGVGYSYFATWDRSEQPRSFEPENRIFEQYILELKLGRLLLNNRIRLEQRFIKQTEKNVFAQRLRHQVQAKFRLGADTAFTKGWYVTLQNEIFVNVQNKKATNDHFLDQNRPYIAIGYRIMKQIDTELGYYYRYQVNEDSRKREHIFQLMISTDF